MAAIFLKLLNLSISASWLVLAVLALRFALRKAPKWTNVLLWGIVALRLMLPFSIESALSLVPSAETVSPAVVQYDPAPTITSGVEIIDSAVNPVISESFAADPAASVNPLFVWTELAGAVWLLGLAAMLIYALVSYGKLRRRVGASLRLEGNVYLCDEVASPFILGIVRPRIYLPSAMDDIQRANVLAHERAHLARRDHWWKPLGFALLAVYWFNPVLWLAYALLCRDIELACDERVLRGMDAEAVKTYSTVLLACSVPRRMIAACPLAFGEVGVKARVKSALSYKKPAVRFVVLALIACAAAAVCFLTNPPRELSKVCGDFWDAETFCTYVEERPDADARYHSADGTVRLSEHLTDVRIGAARPEKTAAVNPKWSTLYLALPDADGAAAERLTIDFIREYDAPNGTEAVYSLNIGTGDAVKSYKVLSGQDEIEAFLAYLRGDAPSLLAAADLDGDGTEEEIFYEEAEPEQLYRIYAADSGGERWSAELGLAHVGWDSYFLFRDGDTSAILRYNPAMFQGLCGYNYELFSVGVDGQRLIAQRSVEFDANPDSDDPWPPEAQAFADEVNALLEKSTLLISTLNGELHLGDGTTFRCAPPSQSAGWDGTAFRYLAQEWDLSALHPGVTGIERVDFAGADLNTLVITADAGEEGHVYFFFDAVTRAFTQEFAGEYLTWCGSDLTTAVYAQGLILRTPGVGMVKTLTLGEGETLTGLSYSSDRRLSVIVTDGTSGEKRSYPIAEAADGEKPVAYSAYGDPAAQWAGGKDFDPALLQIVSVSEIAENGDETVITRFVDLDIAASAMHAMRCTTVPAQTGRQANDIRYRVSAVYDGVEMDVLLGGTNLLCERGGERRVWQIVNGGLVLGIVAVNANERPLNPWSEGSGAARTCYTSVTSGFCRATLAVDYRLAPRGDGTWRIAEITGARTLTGYQWRNGWTYVPEEPVAVSDVSLDGDGTSAGFAVSYSASLGSGMRTYDGRVQLRIPRDTVAEP